MKALLGAPAPRGARLLAGLVVALSMVLPGPAEAQFTFRDLVITGGISGEGYQGNLPSAAVAIRDSTEFASALVGEVGLRGAMSYGLAGNGTLTLDFDSGMRQFAARGFELRSYAPREWVGRMDVGYSRPLGESTLLRLRTRLRGREVEDRPPMPLFLQPGYRSARGQVALDFDGPGDTRLDVEVSGEWNDFLAPGFGPQIRLLDRRAAGGEAGLTTGAGEGAVMRFHGGVEWSHYPEQRTFLTDDPFRRDVTYVAGAQWTHQQDMLAQLGLDLRANRSNSLRPEYNAVTFRALVSASLPRNVSFSAFGAVTVKRYLHGTDFARLIPGEEANNTSLAYLSFSRRLAANLDGTVRVGWTRAESEIGAEYFQRFGTTLLLNYRPRL